MLAELPATLLEIEESPTLYATERARPIEEFFGRPSRPRYAATEPTSGPRRGNRVRHPTLGTGVVLEVDGEGDDAKLTVFFDRAGKKRLIAKYASLEPA
jgi:DNA helicase-2/ATP-dependent DNA helicase PcrA